MTYLLPAQAGAQLASLFVYILVARWYVAPWLASLQRPDALTVLLWPHVFRYIALMTFSAQHDGFPISDAELLNIVIGDVVGAALALAAIAALRRRLRVGIVLAWVLTAETTFDTVTNIEGGIREHLMGAAGGTTWLILVFYVPLIVVSVGLLVWQLYARRGETFGAAAGEAGHSGAATLAAS